MARRAPLPRIDRMSEPPVAGRWYLVPCVRAQYFERIDEWPVIGPEHSDAEFFNFTLQHYHIDGRFLTVTQWRSIGGREYKAPGFRVGAPFGLELLSMTPLQTSKKINPDGLPAPTLRRVRCSQQSLVYPFVAVPPTDKIHAAYAGHQCARGKAGWICPHRKASLGSIAPEYGVVTCPLHGLRIDATTGIVLPAPSPEPPR